MVVRSCGHQSAYNLTVSVSEYQQPWTSSVHAKPITPVPSLLSLGYVALSCDVQSTSHTEHNKVMAKVRDAVWKYPRGP